MAPWRLRFSSNTKIQAASQVCQGKAALAFCFYYYILRINRLETLASANLHLSSHMAHRLNQSASSGRKLASATPSNGNVQCVLGAVEVRTALGDRALECTPMDLDPSSQGTPIPPVVISPTADEQIQFPPVQEPVVQHTERSPQESGTRINTRRADELDYDRRIKQLERGYKKHEDDISEVKGKVDQAERQRQRQRKQDMRQRKKEEQNRLEQRKQDLIQRNQTEQNNQLRHEQLCGLVAGLVTQNMEGRFGYPTSYGSHISPFNGWQPAAGAPAPSPYSQATSPQIACNHPRNSNGRRRVRRTTRAWGAAARTLSASNGIAARGTWTVPDRIPPADGVAGPVRTINSATRLHSTTGAQAQHSPSQEASSGAPLTTARRVAAAGPISPHPSAPHGV